MISILEPLAESPIRQSSRETGQEVKVNAESCTWLFDGTLVNHNIYDCVIPLLYLPHIRVSMTTHVA